MMLSLLSFLGFLSLGAWGYLALAHGLFWRPLLREGDSGPAALPSVDIIVPARDEAEALPVTLPSLLAQDYPGGWRVILVDDHSSDGTEALARKIAADRGGSDRLQVVSAPDLADGWRGKVAAMNVGVTHSQAEMILFTDADIRHGEHSLRHLVARAEAGKLDLVSRMVMLNCTSFAEKLLIPAFVFFFGMLYPFRRANHPKSSVAAAAGGTMLVRRAMLDKIGGMACIKSALIDDCSLARAIKNAGGRIELALTRDIVSIRPYPDLNDVWGMVARTAYTQLFYSPLLLVGTIIGMLLIYIAPPALFLFAPSPAAVASGFLSLMIMTSIYVPMVRFYRLGFAWALTLPIAAFVYLAATIDSARLHYSGRGGQWKGRVQT